MQRVMVVPAQPIDLKRFGVIPMMHLCRLAADRARLPLDPAAFEILVGVGSGNVLFTLLRGERMGLSPVSHVGGVTASAALLTGLALDGVTERAGVFHDCIVYVE
jgi:hypothetical protein